MPDELKLPQWQLYMFFSVDLENSTAYKVSARKKSGSDYDWCDLFNKFYREFPSQFFLNGYEKLTDGVSCIDTPSVWKFVGDEILFYTPLQHSCNVLEHVRIFHDAILRYNSVLEQREISQNGGLDKKVRCKGTMWIAGCPINNRAIKIPNLTDETANYSNLDFIGSSIDCGFRLTKFSSSKQMAISLDLIWMLAESFKFGCVTDGTTYEFMKTRIKFIGYHELKGVCGGNPYPVFVFRVNNAHKENFPERWDNSACQPDELIDFCKNFANHAEQEHFIKPFIDGDSCKFGEKPDEWEGKLRDLYSFLEGELSANRAQGATSSIKQNDETSCQDKDIVAKLKPVSE